MDVASKSMAGMARTFMETSANPKFTHRLDHAAMYAYHIQGCRDIANPGFSPYYTKSFFALLRKIWEEKGSSIELMSEKGWYGAIYEHNKMEVGPNGEKKLRPCRAERQDLGADWEERWAIVNTKGLGPDNTSFLLRMSHDILSTTERVDNTRKRVDAEATGRCRNEECRGATDDREHSLFYCKDNQGIGEGILKGMKQAVPGITPTDILQLKIDCSEEQKPPLIWILCDSLRALWNARKERLNISTEEIRASVEANLTLLQETKFKNLAESAQLLINSFF